MATAEIADLSRRSQWREAVATFAAMRKRLLEPDAIVCNAALGACGKGGQWARSLGMLEEMRRGSLRLDAFSINSAASACERGLQWEGALRCLADAQLRYFICVSLSVSWIAHHIKSYSV